MADGKDVSPCRITLPAKIPDEMPESVAALVADLEHILGNLGTPPPYSGEIIANNIAISLDDVLNRFYQAWEKQS